MCLGNGCSALSLWGDLALVPPQEQSIVPLLLMRQELPLGYRTSITPSLGGETELLQPQSLMITLVRSYHEVFPEMHCGGWMGLAATHVPFLLGINAYFLHLYPEEIYGYLWEVTLLPLGTA